MLPFYFLHSYEKTGAYPDEYAAMFLLTDRIKEKYSKQFVPAKYLFARRYLCSNRNRHTMDKETARYIINYFSKLMTDDEKLALKYHMYTYKTEDSPQMRKLMVDRSWISERPEISEFLKNGYEDFELNVAKRIMKEMPEKVFLNNCPKCNKLARTPFARQCRHCGHSWRDTI